MAFVFSLIFLSLFVTYMSTSFNALGRLCSGSVAFTEYLHFFLQFMTLALTECNTEVLTSLI